MSSKMEYYKEILSSDNLQKCYEIAPPRIKQYLDAEINYVLEKISKNDLVLELGCGYGRVLSVLASKAKKVMGIDNSLPSLNLGKKLFGNLKNCIFMNMNAEKLNFPKNKFDVVVCIQNGISAFHIDQKKLILEAIRVTKPGGKILFSSYSKKFWEHRLNWFKIQSEYGLIGEIDFKKSKNGNIICKDGFTASTVDRKKIKSLLTNIYNIKFSSEEIDESSIFFELIPLS